MPVTANTVLGAQKAVGSNADPIKTAIWNRRYEKDDSPKDHQVPMVFQNGNLDRQKCIGSARHAGSHAMRWDWHGATSAAPRIVNARLMEPMMTIDTRATEVKVLYEWRSKMLREYASGRIFVAATSVEQARDIARQCLDGYLRERYDYLYYDGHPLDEDSRVQLDGYRAAFEDDIAAEPTTCDGAVFVRGSE